MIESGPQINTGQRENTDLPRQLERLESLVRYITLSGIKSQEELDAQIEIDSRALRLPGCIFPTKRPENRFSWGGYIYELPTLWIPSKGVAIRLSPIEGKIMQNLILAEGGIKTRVELAKVMHPGTNPKYLNVHIYRLRGRLADHGEYIETITGIGIRLRPLETTLAESSTPPDSIFPKPEPQEDKKTLTWNGYTLEVTNRGGHFTILNTNKRVRLTPVETAILKQYMLAQGELVSTTNLLQSVWDNPKTTGAVKINIQRINHKLGVKQKVVIGTIAGGYGLREF